MDIVLKSRFSNVALLLLPHVKQKLAEFFECSNLFFVEKKTKTLDNKILCNTKSNASSLGRA